LTLLNTAVTLMPSTRSNCSLVSLPSLKS